MKKCVLAVLLFCLCFVPAVNAGAKAKKSACVVKKNVRIGGRNYRYIKYCKIKKNKIRLISLKTDEDILYIPAVVDGMKVVRIQPKYKEIPGIVIGEYYDNHEGRLCWQTGDKQKLKKIVIAEGVKSIRWSAFAGVRVDEVVLPKSMDYVGAHAFVDSKVKRVVVKGKTTQFAKVEPAGGETEVCGVFAGSDLEKIEFPKGFHGIICHECFKDTKLKTFRWPEYGNQTENDMGYNVFEGCKKLKKIIFPRNQKRIIIPEYTFWRCHSLKKLVFPKSTKKVVYCENYYALNYKKGLAALVFKGKRTELLSGSEQENIRSFPFSGGISSFPSPPEGTYLLSVKKVVAPKGSRALVYASRAVVISRLPAYDPAHCTVPLSDDWDDITFEPVICEETNSKK